MYLLRLPQDDKELDALHDLRDLVLFRGRGKTGYRRDHPKDSDPANHFMGLYCPQENLLGTLRMDYYPDHAILRLVAIDPAQQGQGYGAIMLQQAHDMAFQRHYGQLWVNAALDAVPFYTKLGYVPHIWDREDESFSDGKTNIQMICTL